MKGSVILLLMLLLTSSLFASHDFIIGTGAVSQGFAGSGSADSGEPSIIFLNPSRIAYGDRVRLSLGIALGHKDLRMNSNSFEKGEFSIVEGGFIIPFSNRLKGLYLGLSATFPQPSIMYLYSQDPTYPQFINYRNLLRYSIKPALAYRIMDRLALGVALDVFGNSYGSAKVTIDLANQKTTQSDFIMDQRFTYTPILGASCDISKAFSMALSYRFANRLDLKIDTNFDMQLLNMTVVEDGKGFFIPAEVTMGIKYLALKNLRLLLDLGYVFFSDMPEQYVRIEIEPSVLFPSVKNTERDRIQARDVIRLKIGAGYSLLSGRIEIRGGYQYFPTPIPDQIYETNILDSDRHIFAIGSGFHINDPTGLLINGLDLNIYFQYHYLIRRSFEKVDPLDHYGDYSIDGNVLEGGAGISFSL